ncbi:ATP/GTP-binding protein [Salinibacterium sp. M195]|uniref:GTP-binding protein n=1 Tax=Salinibacterium sp. M195 TaxID=2583374 RepID=UPI001C628177|nr:ATP/GTP-binding protein [Salinibacterium sp. M195]QYH36667.1 ATP-binding protein [Salinibacterium sp. M195]
MPEHVILFAGPMGAGKTTAIRALSEIEVISTEATNSDRSSADKATTTVALDYGEIGVNAAEKVRLYGVPGQRRFDFMWTILAERAEGLLLLVNADAENPVETAIEYVKEFYELYERGGIVIGLTRADLVPVALIEEYANALADEMPDVLIPVLTADARSHDDMMVLLMTLVANVELKQAVAANRTLTSGRAR